MVPSTEIGNERGGGIQREKMNFVLDISSLVGCTIHCLKWDRVSHVLQNEQGLWD